MLSIKINKGDAIPSYRKLYDGNDTAVTFAYENGNVTVSGINTAGITVGDKIRFKRFNCGNEVFSDATIVQSVQQNSISVLPFKDIVLGTKPKREFLKEKAGGSGKWYVVFDIDTEHGFIENSATECDFEIKEDIFGDYSVYNETQKRCPNDYFLYETTFLYKAANISNENKYIFPNSFLNYSDAIIKMYNDTVYKETGLSGDKWKKDTTNKCIFLQNCVVPVGVEGKNNMYRLLWDGAYTTISRGLPDNEGNWENISTFAIEDERFYKIRNGAFTIKENVELYLEETDIKINGVLFDKIDTSLGKKEALQEKFFYEKNEIVDYEKQIFYPVHIKADENEGDVSSITYNLFFRERDDNWKIIDSNYWYGWHDATNTASTKNFNEDGDPVGVLGFDDEDIYYQKKKVSKSFLRLSLYDTKDRKTQTLLGYSVIFLDSVALYRNYVHFINNADEMEKYEKIVAENKMVVLYEGAKLGTNFKCESKYSSDKSSEGFYFYLFPSILGEKPENEKEIYMKAEFNNAKYGKTVPFTMLSDNTPKLHYEKTSGGKAYVDMPALFNDTYIRIGIKYNKDLGKYVWRFKDINERSNTIVINLYEPRVNNG